MRYCVVLDFQDTLYVHVPVTYLRSDIARTGSILKVDVIYVPPPLNLCWMQLREKNEGERMRGKDGKRVRKKKTEGEREGNPHRTDAFSLRRSLFSLILTVYSFAPSVFPVERQSGRGGPLCKACNGFLFSDVNISSTRAHSACNKSPYIQLARLAWEKERKKEPTERPWFVRWRV